MNEAIITADCISQSQFTWHIIVGTMVVPRMAVLLDEHTLTWWKSKDSPVTYDY